MSEPSRKETGIAFEAGWKANKATFMGNVFYYRDEHGVKRDDRLHFDPKVTSIWELEDASEAIRRNMAAGMRYEEAVSLFAPPPLKMLLDRGVPLPEAVKSLRGKLEASIALSEIHERASE